MHLTQATGLMHGPSLARRVVAPHLAGMTASTPNAFRAPRPVWVDALIVIVPVVVASLIGSAVTVPQIPGWYATLVKPAFQPPNWLFGPVWTTLYVMMAFAAWRVLRLPAGTPGKGRALTIYHVQLLLNLLWSCVFFGLQSPLGGIVVILPLLALIVATIALFRPLNRVAANLLWPYLAWVSFATLLTVSIWWLNR